MLTAFLKRIVRVSLEVEIFYLGKSAQKFNAKVSLNFLLFFTRFDYRYHCAWLKSIM
jgi:hypothetical protein